MRREGTQKWHFLIFHKNGKSDIFDEIFQIGFCVEP
jgi:hypothetical protein